MLIGFLNIKSRNIDILINPIQQTALLDNNILQLLINIIQCVDGGYNLQYLLVSLIG